MLSLNHGNKKSTKVYRLHIIATKTNLLFIYGNDRQWGLVTFGGLSPLGACRLWGTCINKYAQESACDSQMVVTDKRFLLVPMDRPHWIFRGRVGSKKVRPIRGDLR